MLHQNKGMNTEINVQGSWGKTCRKEAKKKKQDDGVVNAVHDHHEKNVKGNCPKSE